MLAHVSHGTATGLPTLLIAHGLFGSARNWSAIARRMATDRRVIAVDMRNHGQSPWMPTQSYPDMAADLAATIVALDLGSVDLVGHSMGGKAAMQLALTEGGLVNRLVVADIAPVDYGRSLLHLIEAMRDVPLETLTSRAEADLALARGVEDPGVRAFLLQSLDLKALPPRWRLNLDVLAAEMAGITGWPGTEGRFDGPALFLAGGLSDYVRPEHRAEIKRLFPAATLAKIPGAGHWLHAERPEEFVAALRVFLD